MRLAGVVVLCLAVKFALSLNFYCSPYCGYSGQTPLCQGSSDFDCTDCDNVTFVAPSGLSPPYPCSFVPGEAYGGQFSENMTTGSASTGFTPTWGIASSNAPSGYLVFGPFNAAGQSYQYTVLSLGTNHYQTKLVTAMYVTTDYDGAFGVTFLSTTVSLLYGTAPSTSYTLGANGAEYGYVKTTQYVAHVTANNIPNDAINVTFAQSNISTAGNIFVREALVVVQLCNIGCLTCDSFPMLCSSCTTVATIDYYLSTSGTGCSTTCQTNQYKGTGSFANRCVICNVVCATCTDSSAVCTTCASGYPIRQTDNSCVSSCNSNQYLKVAHCYNCPTGCAACTGGTLSGGFGVNCTACATPYYLIYGTTQCNTACPATQYAEDTDTLHLHECRLCSAPCVNCVTSATNCQSCQSGFSLHVLGTNSQTCLSVCPNGFYSDGTYCVACPNGCSVCSGAGTDPITGEPNQCTSCTVPFYLLQGSTTCSSTCPTGQYPHSNSGVGICENCASGCTACTGATLNDCQACGSVAAVSYYLVQGQTVCATTCPDGQFADAASGNHRCEYCQAPCERCSVAGTNCTFCKNVSTTDYFLDGNACVTSCSGDRFGNVVTDPTITNECVACSAGCVGCTSSGYAGCTSCTFGTAKLWLAHGTTICDTVCPSGQYMGSGADDNRCLLCATTCLTCTGSSTNCVTCNPGELLHQDAPGTWTCVTSCPTGYYQDSINAVCNKCPVGCASCIGGATSAGFGTQCSSCQTQSGTPYYLIAGATTCSTSCPNGQFMSSSNMCGVCASGCATCTAGTLNDCTSCSTSAGISYYLALSTTTCATTCPAGQFPDVTGGTHRCLACSASCTKCQGLSTNCTFCRPPSGSNRFLLNGMCLLTCPQYFYGLVPTDITLSNFCDACTPGCDVCTAAGLTACSVCGNDGSADYYLAVGTTTCATICPNGQFMGSGADMHKCLICNVECATCQGTALTCLTCSSGYNRLTLTAGGISCVAQCPTEMYSNTTDCLTCPAGCSACSSGVVSGGFGQQCSACKNESATVYMLVFGTTVCSTSCPNGQFAGTVTTSNLCLQCANGCATCTGATLNNCLTCASYSGTSYYLVAGTTTCATNCPSGQYKDINGGTLTCLLCDLSCVDCLGIATNCTVCGTTAGVTRYMSVSGCVDVCPAGFYGWLSGQVGVSNRCLACSPGCAVCSGSGTSNCTQCSNDGVFDYYLVYGTTICSPYCPPGQFADTSNGLRCLLCDASCSTCENTSTTCIDCAAALLKTPASTCVATCPVGTMSNTTDCVPILCNQACASCIGTAITQCLSCRNNGTTDFFKSLTATECLTVCPAGQFADISTFTCQLCSTSCLECATTSTTCTKCRSTTYLYASSCLSSCPALGTYPNNLIQTCSPCAVGCLQCFGSTSINCTACGTVAGSHYYLNQATCATTCPTGFFIDDTNFPNRCVSCSAPCSTCIGSASACTTCLSGYYMYAGGCVTSCPAGYFASISTDPTIKGLCQQCTSGCTACFAAGLNSCSACGTITSTLYFLALNTNTCSTTCPSGQFPDSASNLCVACSSSCRTCSLLASNCTSCRTIGTTVAYLSNFACVTVCPAGYYTNVPADISLSNTCEACTTGCAECYGPGISSCTRCALVTAVQYYLASSTCYTSCPTGQYALTTNNTCQLCDVSCYNCSSTSVLCGNCNIGFAKQSDGTCSPVCSTGTYSNGTSCVSCDAACQTCYGPFKTTCYTCKNNGTLNFFKSLSANTCGASCAAGQYADLPTFACVKCDYRCSSCTGSAINCSSCATVSGVNHYLLNSACLDVCPVLGYYAVAANNTCQPCATGCKSCVGGLISSCTACLNVGTVAYYLGATDTTCYTTCPDGQFKNDATSPNQCLKCDASCTKCSGTPTNCTFCGLMGSTSIYLYSGTCLTICPNGYYALISTTSSNKCAPCASGCSICTGAALTNCQACTTVGVSDYYLDIGGTTCALTCLTGQFAGSNHQCASCDPNCAQCVGTATNCTFCSKATGMFLYQSVCYSVCPSGFFGAINSLANTTDACLACTTGCLTCTTAGLTSCMSCGNNGTADFYLSGTTCATSCPNGQYAGAVSSHQCFACTAPCTRCVVSATRCTFCINGYFLSGTTCVATCPSGQYGLVSSTPSTVSNTCEICTPGCATCTLSGLNNCTSCNSNGTVDFWKDATDTVCRTACIAGQYQGATGTFQCLACDAACTQCSILSTNCTFCKFAFPAKYLSGDICVATCPNGFYGKTDPSATVSDTCEPCAAGCAICTTALLTGCAQCSSDAFGNAFYLGVGSTTCYNNSCPNGQYIDAAASPHVCLGCSASCAKCSVTASNCTFCTGTFTTPTFLNTTSSSCIASCATGYYGFVANSTTITNECKVCFDGCLTCTAAGNASCQSCGSDSAGRILYKWVGPTVCDVVCPSGSYIDSAIPYVCQACNILCVICNSQIKCLNCYTPYYYDAPLLACVNSCRTGYFMNRTDSTSFYCSLCTAGCKTCTNAGLQSCTSCQNDTANNVVYYLRRDATECVTTCPAGTYGVASNNTCQPCGVGCATCLSSPTNCQSCKNDGGVSYFKPLNSNTCVTDCPDATFNNGTINQCQPCIYFTYNNKCVQNCPENTKSVFTPVPVCAVCNETCSEPNYSFKVASVLTDGGESLMNSVKLPVKLSPNVTINKNTKMSVYLERDATARRLLSDVIVLSVKDVEIDASGQVIRIKSSAPADSDMTAYTLKVDFASGVLISIDGYPIDATTNTFALSTPTFVASYYTYKEANNGLWTPGILFIIVGLVMCFVSDWNDRVLNEWLWFEMFLQVLGLMRYSTYPVIANAYNILQGFSVLEFLYVPNFFANLLPAIYGEMSYPIVSFVNVNHNFIVNIGSELFIFLLLQVPILAVLAWKRQAILPRILRIEETLVTLFFCRTFFSCVLSLIGLGLNADLVPNSTFFACQVVGFIFLLMYIGYFVVRVREARNLQLYKLNVLLVIIAVPFLSRMLTVPLFFINLIEVVFAGVDFYFYRNEKTNRWVYLGERVLMLVGYNVAVTVQTLAPLLVLLILVVGGLIAMKSWVFYQEWKLKSAPVIEPESIREASLGVKDSVDTANKDYLAEQRSAANIIEDNASPASRPNVFDQDCAVQNTHENTQNNLMASLQEIPYPRTSTAKRQRSQKLQTLNSEPKEEEAAVQEFVISGEPALEAKPADTQVNFFKPTLGKNSSKRLLINDTFDNEGTSDIILEDHGEVSPERQVLVTTTRRQKDEIGKVPKTIVSQPEVLQEEEDIILNNEPLLPPPASKMQQPLSEQKLEIFLYAEPVAVPSAIKPAMESNDGFTKGNSKELTESIDLGDEIRKKKKYRKQRFSKADGEELDIV